MQWYAFSTLNCINAEIGNLLSPRGNATVHCRICTSVSDPLGYPYYSIVTIDLKGFSAD